jgi:tRNA threonylcarbamoyladenosine biosynthesis protein TsaE
MHLRSTSPEMTRQIGRVLAGLVRAGDLIALIGPLGAGKTCFAQGLASGLGIREVVSSPSFVLAKHYPGSPGFLHVDAYRLSSAAEFWELGLADQMEANVTVVEWADRVAQALPDDRVEFSLQYADGDTRMIEVRAGGERRQATVRELERALPAKWQQDPPS